LPTFKQFNYFNGLTKLFLTVAKCLDTSTKPFYRVMYRIFMCRNCTWWKFDKCL